MNRSTSAAVGMSYDTLTMAREVVEAAKDRTLPPEVREVTRLDQRRAVVLFAPHG